MARTQRLGTAVGLVATIGTLGNTVTYRVMLQTEQQVTAELIMSTAPWGEGQEPSGVTLPPPPEFPSLLLGVAGEKVAGDLGREVTYNVQGPPLGTRHGTQTLPHRHQRQRTHGGGWY